MAGSAFDLLINLTEDPRDDGTYELHLKGADYDRLYNAAMADANEIDTLRAALYQAATSLRTIATGGGRIEGLEDLQAVRGYANSRCNAAAEVLEGQQNTKGTQPRPVTDDNDNS